MTSVVIGVYLALGVVLTVGFCRLSQHALALGKLIAAQSARIALLDTAIVNLHERLLQLEELRARDTREEISDRAVAALNQRIIDEIFGLDEAVEIDDDAPVTRH
jgi:Tfp pilus assembly protein PilN